MAGMTATAAAGWFPDPNGTPQLRWWDGVRWTAHLVPLPDGAIDEPAEYHALAWTHGGRLRPAGPPGDGTFALPPVLGVVSGAAFGLFLGTRQAFPAQLWLIAVVAMVSSLAVGWRALWNRWRILDTPTLDAAGARPGQCEIAGTCEPLPGQEPVVAHLSGRPVVAYRVAVDRRERSGDSSTWVERWSYADVGAVRTGFLLRSPGGGAVVVRLSDPGRALRDTAEPFEVSGPSGTLWGTDRFRLREGGIALSDPLFCLGEASLAEDGTVVLDDPQLVVHGDERAALKAESAKVAAALNAIVMTIVAVTVTVAGTVTVTISGRDIPVPSPRALGSVVGACALVAGLALTIRWWNRLVALREQVRAAWGHIEADLQRRHDTVGRLVAVVSAASAHEAEALRQAAGARYQPAGAVHDGVPDDRRVHGAADAIAASAAGEQRLVALAEALPSLHTDENFRSLFDALAATENRIAAGRRFYNDAITLLDTRVDRLPGLLVRRWVLPHPRPTLLRFDDRALPAVGIGTAQPPPPPAPTPMPEPPATRPPLPPPPPPPPRA